MIDVNMTPGPFQFTRLQEGQTLRTPLLMEALRAKDPGKETWLFVSPHDDDLAVGAGLWLQAAVRAGVNVQVLVVTDGRMGYCSMDQKDRIVEIRKAEAIASFQILGIPASHLHFLNFPDGGLYASQGRRLAATGENAIAGYTGLQNAFTHHLRHVRPARVLVPTPTDLHPDHQITHNELMICLFHSAGDIWPELGRPLTEVPAVYELAIYCDFASPPNLELRTSQPIFETKLKSIAAYKSQAQIASLVESQRQAGPVEYLREVNFQFYSPANHVKRFE